MKKYKDYYFHKAKKENFPARSVYKLKEIDRKFVLLKPGLKVLDLGAKPGSWSAYAATKVGPGGKVLAVDIKDFEYDFPPQVTLVQADVSEPSEDFRQILSKWRPFQLTLSDMAPRTTGVGFADAARSADLALAALELAVANMERGGNFVVKVLEGPEIPEFLVKMRSIFNKVKPFKPKSSRPESREIFIVGLNMKG